MPASVSNPLIRKLDELSSRFDLLREQLNDPAVLANHQKVVPLSRESGQLEPIVGRYREYRKLQDEIAGLEEMSKTKGDPEMAETVKKLKEEMYRLKKELKDDDQFADKLPKDDVDGPPKKQ